MAHIKKFEEFVFNDAPIKEPKTKPSGPTTIPGTRPGRPSPIRRTEPAVKPKPKAEIETATIQDVVYKYIELSNKEANNEEF